MSFLDRLRVSLRYIRGRMVESILVVLATAVGVALVAAMAAFIRSYNEQTEYLLDHPAYRELLVEAVGNESELDEPAVAYDSETTSEVSLGYEDIGPAMESATTVSYGYIADAEQLSTQTLGGGRGLRVAGAMAGREMPMPESAPEDMPGGFPVSDAAGGEPAGTGNDAVVAEDRRTASTDAGVAASDRMPTPGGPGFDLEQFFAAEEGVLTELPLDSFAGRRVTPSYFDAYGLEVAEGSVMTVEDIESGNQVIVLGSSLADTLFPEGGAVGTRVRLNMQTYTVVGVLAESSLTDPDTGASFNNTAFVPNSDARISFAGREIRVSRPTRTIRFAVDQSASLEQAAAELEAYFDAEFGEDAVRVSAPLEELTTEREKLSRVLSVVLFLAAAGLFIASINLFNLMLMRVIKRTKSIGITRAVGATRNGITRQFLNESALMSMTGAVIGLVASPFVYGLLRRSLITGAVTSATVEWSFLLAGAAGAFLFSLVFGVFPARQAGRIDAAIAIRTE